MLHLLTKYRATLLPAAIAAVVMLALVATSSGVSAQTPAPPKATATATAAAPAKAPVPGKTGNAGIEATTSTSAVLIVGLVVLAGGVTLLSRRATGSR